MGSKIIFYLGSIQESCYDIENALLSSIQKCWHSGGQGEMKHSLQRLLHYVI